MATIRQIDKIKKAKIKDIPLNTCDIEETDNTIKAVVIKENVDATTTRKGIIRIATDNEASEGISENTAITPHTLKNATENKIDEIVSGNDLIDVQRDVNTVTITSKTFIFEQGIASKDWTIIHNLNKRPTVFAVDSSGRVQLPDEIVYDSDNQLTVQFASSFAGYAYLN